MTKNINPIYLQEVSREYYDRILNKSFANKNAARLTRKWAKNNPNASKSERLLKFIDVADFIHGRDDELKNRFLGRKKTEDESKIRRDYVAHSALINHLVDDPDLKKKGKEYLYQALRAKRMKNK